ncbi:MAG: ABC transporter ATP-binding protein [Sphingobacteriales bacterium 17-39-43]|uniref:ABC transporter ATP-binding protein n=1 Tax=Daejeonella sp. TaxID=2805397 RepID=UPI000BD0A891|nr:ABC transporter ATP-binding protein [Daejeonella sp.]OYY03715.1 MAG: ABC transporter ATP-binding protein [Sphingobacteriia bacterium 35-40-5]OYZ29245.1 MAG: ABC transporter ATP-binding protein [Sphingobacteriales bacterium 16-39-50]OZA22441.1 MAG: ABC transporter ATP-binding protein [Sphingobacteriales bacterium 17-39-43]HQS51831.1 ABC transporter ATP-binding protein [Daejeonella sp.]HQT23361.1 ABC transporter ATP-binding protein [Daejeonella sp.]
MSSPIISLKGLTKHYGSLKAVDDLNLDVQKAEIFGLLGPNGAGKTTSILMMLGLTEPSSGTAHVCGYNATSNPIAVKKKVGYMPDNLGFYDQMSALENLVYIGRLNGLAETKGKARAIELLELLGLKDVMHKKTGTFSRGMKQRLGLADVLIKEPEVIILDEPTLGIDPAGVKDFLALIKQLSKQQGLTVLLSSHHLHQVQQVCDRVGIFVNGKLLAQGNIDTLSQSLFGTDAFVTTINLTQAVPQPWPLETELKQFDALKKIMIHDQEIEFTCSREFTAPLVRFLVEKGYDILGVHQKSYGLDEIYQKYFESNSINQTKP